MSAAAPLRFLALVLGGWIAVRAAMLAPGWWPASETAAAPQVAPTHQPPALAAISRQAAPQTANMPPFLPHPPNRHPGESRGLRAKDRSLSPPDPGFRRDDERVGWAPALLQASNPVGTELSIPPILPPMAAPHRTSFPSRWSISAWALVRNGDGPQLAPGGTLGGSQAGARITYRLRERLLLSGRVSTPLARAAGAETALGIEWRPIRAVPVRLLAERRQAVGRDGRSAFALLAHGGISDRPIVGPVLLDAYAQAGLVGARSRDAFIDGAARLGVPVADGLSLGVGAWGAAQPGASRLDLGPQLSWRPPALGEKVRIAADWRVRIVGDARPGSGPALTLSTDF